VKNVLILGTGFIGQRLAQSLGDSYVVHNIRAEINDMNALTSTLNDFMIDHKVDVIINAIGKTGKKNVDDCETEQIATFYTNVVGLINLATYCQMNSIYLIHIGSGCVYYDDKLETSLLRSEEDPAYPISTYSKSKYAGDLFLSTLQNVASLRIRMPIDYIHSERNLLTKLIKYDKVLGIKNSITCIPDFINVVKNFIENKHTGIYNVVNEGVISPAQIMLMYSEKYPTHKFEIVHEMSQLGDLIKKNRSNCILSISKLNSIGIQMPHVRKSVAQIIEKYL